MFLWSHVNFEIEKMAELVLRSKATTVVEIGCYQYGMTTMFLCMLPGSIKPPSFVIGIDLEDKMPSRREMLESSAPQSFKFVKGSSYDPATINQVKELLGDRQIDILFIDGNHSAGGVERDSYNYLKYMNPEGFIIWHDATRRHGIKEAIHSWFLFMLNHNIRITMFLDDHARLAYIKVREFIEQIENNPEIKKIKDIVCEKGVDCGK